MKALNSLQTLSNRLKYSTICVLKYSRDCKPRRVCERKREWEWMNEKRINAAPPYLSLDVLKSRHSHVPHFEPWIWIEAKKWLSFAFISSLALCFFPFKFTIFSTSSSSSSSICLCKIRCRFFPYSKFSICFDFRHSWIHSCKCLPHLGAAEKKKETSSTNIEWTMHKNVYNFFIIFQYFSAFLRSFQCKIYGLRTLTKMKTLSSSFNSWMQWLRKMMGPEE